MSGYGAPSGYPPPGPGAYPPPGGYGPPPDYYNQPQHSGNGGKGGGDKVNEMGGFLKRNAPEAALAAFNYKCGGTIGKMFAAGQAADLAQRYNHEQKEKKYDQHDQQQHQRDQQYYSQPTPHYQGQPQGYGNSSSSSNYGAQAKNIAGSVLTTGQQLFTKAKNNVGQKEKKQDQQYYNQPTPHYQGQQQGYGNSSSSSNYGSQAKNIAGSVLTTGQQLFTKAEKSVGKYISGGETMKQLQSGVVIQLISQVTGRAIQIVSSPDGRLVLDANGMESPQAYNAHFTVIREGEKVVMLHNNFNYVALMNGQLMIHMAGPGGAPTPNCRLRVHEPQSRSISFESAVEQAVCLGIQPSGHPKPPCSTNYKDHDAMFSIKVVFAPSQY